ncbi:MAG: histidine kinase dimerization/phosphoacceptor domain -containing protein [Taibaiella sp.]|jgi:two-component sensor histidine kinase
MCKGIFMLMLFLTCMMHMIHAQTTFKNEAEVNDAKLQVRRLPADGEKVKLLQKLARWYMLQELDSTAIKKSEQYVVQSLNISNKLKDKVGTASGYLLLSKVYQIGHDYLKGRSYAENAAVIFKSLEDMNQAGEAYVMLWSNNALGGMPFADRIPFLEKAADCFHKVGNKCREADCLREQGDLYHILGQFGFALNSLKKAIELSRGAHCQHLAGTYDLLGVCYVMLGDYKAAIQNGLMAIKIAEKDGEDSTLSLCTYYNRLGMAYLRADDDPKAKKCLEKSMAIALKCNDRNSIFVLTITNASLLVEEGNPRKGLKLMNRIIHKYPELEKERGMDLACFMITAYQTLKLFDKARTYAAMIEHFIAEDSSNYAHLALAYNRLLPFYIETGHLDKAKLYAEKYRVFCYKVNVPIYKSSYHIMQFMLDSANGNYRDAIRNYQRYTGIKDSLFNETRSMQISQLNILYETEKKDNDILLLKKESELQQSNLKNVTLIRNITFGGVALLTVILFLLLNGFRRKQRTNKVLQSQQNEIGHKNDALQKLVTEKEWLVKEIHHRVKNNLHMVVGLLASQTEFLKGEEALAAITDSQNRIYAMSLIHQKLYQTEELSFTNMPSYIFDLIEYLKSSFDQASDITFRLNITEVEFSLVYSVPIGLIINEAVTNAIKYAFPKGKGKIEIGLQHSDASGFILYIQDDGVGLPVDFNFHECSSLGLILMEGLSTDIEGTFHISSNKGTRIEIRFVDEESRNEMH